MLRTKSDPQTTHAGPDYRLGLPGEQLDLAAGTAGTVEQIVEQLPCQQYRVREPHGDVTTSGPSRRGIPVQHFSESDLFTPVEAVDQRKGPGDGGLPAPTCRIGTPRACPVRSTT
jgi:hypothetical protein